jgi:hypothetical protein
MSVPCANSSVTRLRPSSDRDVTRSRFGIPDSAFSSGSVTIVSISSGPTFA